MLGQLRNEIGKRAAASSSDAAADEELVAAAKKGDELGFESLARRYQRRIFALAFRYTRVREDAEDIVQETFQKAFVHLQKFEGKSSFSTWLTRIAINGALMSLRRRRALHEVPADDSSGDHGTTPGPDLADASPDPEATYLQKEQARIVSAAIRHLRPGMRGPVELRELGDLSTQKTARRMGLSVAAIKGRVFRARKELGRALRRHVRSHRTSGGNITAIVRNDTSNSQGGLTCAGTRAASKRPHDYVPIDRRTDDFDTGPDSVIRTKHDQ